MPELKDAGYERFAEQVAVGVPPFRATKQSGFKDGRQAWRLMRRPEIQTRVAELIAEHRAAYDVTIEELTAKYRHAWKVAVEQGDVAGQNAATTGLAKLHGFLVDKSVNLHGDVSKLASLPREDFERLHQLLDARQRDRLVGTGGQAALPDKTLQLQAIPEAEGVPQSGTIAPRNSAHGEQPIREIVGRGDGVGDAPDGQISIMVGREKVPEAG